MSGPYLWNRYSQRLQIKCAAWSCGLILHCCLPSNSLRYWTKVRGIAPRSHRGRSRTCLVIIIIIIIIIIISDPRRGCFMGLSMFIFLFFSLFFSATILSSPYLWNRYSQRLQIECAACSCGLVLHYCLPSNSLRYFCIFFLFFSPRFCPGHISGTVNRRDSKLSVLLGSAV